MGIMQSIGLLPGPAAREASTRDREVAILRQDVEATSLNLERAMESIQDLAREDQGWANIGAENATEPDRSVLVSNADLVRAFSGMNPLMVRAKNVRAAYVWGQGCTVESPDEDVQEVVAAFFEDRGNQDAVFGGQARTELEHDNFDDGNVFLAHWVDPMTGGVRVRTIPFTEITEIYTAPGDRSTPQFYRRQWTEAGIGDSSPRTLVALYPALDYDPATQPKQAADGTPILWPGTVTTGKGLVRHSGAAIYHEKVNPVGRYRKWGVGDGFAAMPWARAYKGALEDSARLYHALAKIAYVMSGTKDKAQMKRMAENAVNGQPGGAVYGDGITVSTPNFSGMDPAKYRPFAAMVASAVGLAVTILTADPGQEGARAVAETLDTPQRLLFEARQGVWADYYRAAATYRVKQSIIAPRGELRGTVKREGDRTTPLINGEPVVIQVDFPSIEDDNLTTLVEAITKADTTGKLPPLEVLRLLLRAFKIEDADTIIDQMTDDDGNWVDPSQAAADAAGQAAANALRSGGNPADVL